MNAISRIAVLSLSVLGLAACAGTQARTSHVAPAAVEAATASASSVNRDDRYIATVERIARRRGIGVVWINPPNRARAVAQQVE